MAKMTRRQRMQGIYAGQVPDRAAVKVWGAEPWQVCAHPAFNKVRDLAAAKSDLLITHPFSCFQYIYCGANFETLIEIHDEPTDSPEWLDEVTIYHTPMGDLREVNYKSTKGKPGYEKEFPLKEPDDIRKLLSLPYEPRPVQIEKWREREKNVGDAGITQYHLDNPLCALQRIIGSESFAFWSFEAEDLTLEACRLFGERVRAQVKAALALGIKGPFGWVGPELCIPPLMPMSAFEKFVFHIDKQTIDLIHNGGGTVWVHSHGKMKPVLERFMAMGVDVLNPLEPPPMGDVAIDEAFRKVGNKMALEGNIETHDIMTKSKECVIETVRAILDAGKGHRQILCSSAGYYENVEPTGHEIGNWITYIEEGVRYADEVARR